MEKVYSRTIGIRDDMVDGFCPGCMHIRGTVTLRPSVWLNRFLRQTAVKTLPLFLSTTVFMV